MKFNNNLPIVVHCGWCHDRKKDGDKWVPMTDADRVRQTGVLISHGMCPVCEERWEAQEKRINNENRTKKVRHEIKAVTRIRTTRRAA
jgi:hypothetical protein